MLDTSLIRLSSSLARLTLVALGLLVLTSCAKDKDLPATASEESQSGPETALAAGVAEGPPIDDLGLSDESAQRAFEAFRTSCPSLVRRADLSGLTRPEDWIASCDAAGRWPKVDALSFFNTHFEPVRIGDGSAFATGYFEPKIAGSRTRGGGYQVPVYGAPADLIEADLGAFVEDLKGRRVRGRVDDGKLVPYYDRAAIEDGALGGRGLEIAWAADPIDLFFLEIQGSGQLGLPDGKVMRIGYATQNGRGYTAIGRLMKERGLLTAGRSTMQDIVAWLRQNPEQGRAIMRENKSYVFFREVTGPGPLGALGLPVTPRGTVAADPKFVPLGAPVILSMDRAEANGLWIAQDTGGAIKGANRFDTFWGAGDEAARLAGGMAARGTAVILLPKGSAQRRTAVGRNGTQAGR